MRYLCALLMRFLLVILLALFSAFSAAAQSDSWLIGTWKAWRELPGQSDFEYLELNKNHTGYQAQGGMENGREILMPYLINDLKKWVLTGDTLFCHTRPDWSIATSKIESKVFTYIITAHTEDSFTAVFIDPGSPPTPAEYQPLPFRFVRSK